MGVSTLHEEGLHNKGLSSSWLYGGVIHAIRQFTSSWLYGGVIHAIRHFTSSWCLERERGFLVVLARLACYIGIILLTDLGVDSIESHLFF
jgi:hypothetical protein